MLREEEYCKATGFDLQRAATAVDSNSLESVIASAMRYEFVCHEKTE
jgi:hypothetical protein